MKINFLPDDEKIQGGQWRYCLPWGLSIFLISTLTAVSLYFKQVEKGYMEQQHQIQIEMNHLQPSCRVAKQLIKEKENAKKQIETFNRLKQKKQHWSSFIKNLEQTRPVGVNLEELTIKENNYLTLEGKADAYEQIVDWLNAMQESHYFNQLSIGEMVREGGANDMTIRFSIQGYWIKGREK